MSESRAKTDAFDDNYEPILAEADNCWCKAPASRVTTLVDTADYFAAFAKACESAQRQILILGWDFDRRERLFRDDAKREHPDTLGAFLASLVKSKRDLRIYLLSWDFNMIYAAERELLPALRLRLQAPPRFHFRLDGVHPKGASHHQKIVVVDDRIAFVGGIDLSRWRWDTSEHLPDDPRRTDPNGKPYPPFHDMMMLVEGDAAARLGDLARQRWRRARGWKLKPPEPVAASPWPDDIEAALHDVDVAIARTQPPYRRDEGVREVERLYLDAIRAARHLIYIENQYFTAHSLANALAERLAEKHGPEVVIVLPEKTGGWLEQVTMDVVRGRILDQLTKADKHDRLRIYFPYQPGLGDHCISVHAKLLIVDDRLLRVGSSNTSNRSMGLDTECDLAIEAERAGDDRHDYIRSMRERLLAEHLGCPVAETTRVLRGERSMIRGIEKLRCDERSLRPLVWEVDGEVDEMVPDDTLIDPSEPFSPDYFVSEYIPRSGRVHGRRRLLVFVGLVVALFAMAAAWRWTPLDDTLSPERISAYLATFSSPWTHAAIALGVFVVASLAMVPVTLLAIVGGVVFDGAYALAYVLAGAMVSSLIGFVVGRVIGRDAIRRWYGARFDHLRRRLTQRGTVAVAILRLVPVAPFAIFNLVAGSAKLGARPFLVGSLLGLAPALGAVTLFSAALWQALTEPSLRHVAMAFVLGAGLLLIAWWGKRWLRTS